MFFACKGWHLKAIGSSRGALQKTNSLQSAKQEPARMAPKTLISFGTPDSRGFIDFNCVENSVNQTRMSACFADVDGTLIRSMGANANKLHKDAFAAGFRDVFGIETTIDVVPHHGSTDPLILVKVLEFHGIDKQTSMEKLPEMQEAMVKHFLERRSEAGEGLEILPGVVDLLRILKDNDDVSICLCTGNLEPIAWEKMGNLGIKELFTEPFFGGFGSDFCSGNTEESWKDRSELIKIAAARAAELVGEPERRFHVGDAPMDVQAALAAGSVPIGVLTGIYTEENLRSACPNAIILDDLCDISQVLSTLNL